jgi:hypothetical protein
MKMTLAFVAVLYSAAAFAQSGPPPMVGDKPLVQVKPRTAAAKPQSMAVRLQSCLDIDDGTKERLTCYDTVLPPAPKPKAGAKAGANPAAAKAVTECKFTREEDERLSCYNGFVESMPKLPKS